VTVGVVQFVEQSTHDPLFEGSKPASAGTGIKNQEDKKILFKVTVTVAQFVEQLTSYGKLEC
jgi:hypothetical protein